MSDFDEALDGLGAYAIASLYYDWSLWARPSQQPPEGQWRVWLLMAGRGFGKTRTGAEWIRALAQNHAGCEIGLVGASFDDARHVMVDGPSGILHVSAPHERPLYLSSRHQLLWPNGSRARLFAADKPSQLRGPEFHFAWADEIAKWRYQEAWDNLMMGLRRGANPAVIATTTPRPLPWLIALSKAEDTALVQGRSIENEANLSPGFMAAMQQSYGGTRLARQELDGELLYEMPDALFRRQDIENYRATPPPRETFIRLVIGVDPAIGGANETGIIVAGKTADHHIWLLGDYTLTAQPHIWAARLRQLYSSWRADCVVVEVNYLFQNDMAIASDILDIWCAEWRQFSAPRCAALLSMAFNLGGPRLSGFRKMRQALLRHDFDEAASQALDSKWAGQVPRRAKEIAAMIAKG